MTCKRSHVVEINAKRPACHPAWLFVATGCSPVATSKRLRLPLSHALFADTHPSAPPSLLSVQLRVRWRFGIHEMPSATSSVDSGGDEPDSSDDPYSIRHVATPPAPDIREIVSAAAAAQDASSSDQASTAPGRDNEVSQTATGGIMSSRAYQLEMLDQSLRQNVIVAVCQATTLRRIAILVLTTATDGHGERQDTSVRSLICRVHVKCVVTIG